MDLQLLEIKASKKVKNLNFDNILIERELYIILDRTERHKHIRIHISLVKSKPHSHLRDKDNRGIYLTERKLIAEQAMNHFHTSL